MLLDIMFVLRVRFAGTIVTFDSALVIQVSGASMAAGNNVSNQQVLNGKQKAGWP